MNRPRSSRKFMLSAEMRRSLLAWFRRNRARVPWRENRDPYRVWVSEVMLQQTRIAAVIPYYKRFLREFPTVGELARSRRERVLKFWAGMGYYRRAENLHRAARILVRRHGGKFPSDFEKATALPGIGDYTARAILSIAYKRPLAVMDGNVARVVSRLDRLSGNPSGSAFQSAVRERLDGLLSRREPGNFNQAIMELGQTVCLPRSPHCPRCPLRRFCAAYHSGDAERFPARRRRPQSRRVYLASLVLGSGSRVLMVRGLEDGLLGGLWNFPSTFGNNRKEALYRLRKGIAKSVGGRLSSEAPIASLEHHITFRKIRVDIYKASADKRMSANGSRWMELQTLKGAAVSALARKVCAAAVEHDRKLSGIVARKWMRVGRSPAIITR